MRGGRDKYERTDEKHALDTANHTLFPPDRADDGESSSFTPPEQETNARDTGKYDQK